MSCLWGQNLSHHKVTHSFHCKERGSGEEKLGYVNSVYRLGLNDEIIYTNVFLLFVCLVFCVRACFQQHK